MNITDPIADLLTRIRNGQKAGHEVVNVPASKMKISVAHILKNEGFIRNYRCVRDNKQGILKLALKYDTAGDGVITDIKRTSKSSRRVYVKAGEIPYVRNGFGISVISTSRGIMADRDARKLKIGGELICSVY